jgi:hypothetical protein
MPATVQYLPPRDLKSWPRNARTHPDGQVKQLARSIRRFGFTHPVLIDEHGRILAGHGRVQAAIQLGLTEVPCIAIDHLSETEKRAYVIADNKLALNSGWDRKLLAEEMKLLVAKDINFDVGAMGFSLAETKRMFEGSKPDNPEGGRKDNAPPRCRPGDTWQLGPHLLFCTDPTKLDTWWDDDAGQMIITVPSDRKAKAGGGKTGDEWHLTTLAAADEAGRRAIFSEKDCARCDRIIRHWEARAKAQAVRIERDNAEKPEQMEAAK